MVRFTLRCTLLAALTLASLWSGFSPGVSAAQAPEPAAWIPEGFENLLEMQTTVVDVYYGGRRLGSILVDFNPEVVEIADPAALVEAIPTVTDVAAVVGALRGELPNNADSVCYSRFQDDCGALYPEVAAVIFNEAEFRLDLFIGRDYLSAAALVRDSFLPPSDSDFGAISLVTGAFSGTDDDLLQTTSVNFANSISMRENRLVLNTNYTEGQDWTIDEMLLRRDYRGREYTAGYFRTTNDAFLRFVPEEQMRGLRFASTLYTRVDLESASGQQISVFLATRARVGIFRDGRLLTSRLYEAGNQILDTTNLPAGVYPITLRIEEIGGGVREETRFYSKNTRFPPRDQTLFGIEVGEEVRRFSEDVLPEGQGNVLARASLSTRLADTMALNGGVSVRDSLWVGEVGIDHVGTIYDLQINGAASDNDGYGFAVAGRLNTPWLTLTTSYRQTWVDNPLEELPEEPGFSDVPLPDLVEIIADPLGLIGVPQERAFFTTDSTQVNFSAMTPIGDGSFNINARYQEEAAGRRTEEVAFRFTKPIWRQGRYDLRLDAEANWINERWQGLFTLNLRRDSRHVSQGYQYTARYQDINDTGSELYHEGSANVIYNDITDGGSDYSLSARAETRADFDSVGAEARYRGAQGRANLQVDQLFPEQGEDRLAVAGNFGTSIGTDLESLAVGGADQTVSGVVIALEGASDDTVVDVIVNGSRRGSAVGSGGTLVSLPPFETYSISLLPRGGGLVSYDGRPQTVTLYPGNLTTLKWDVSPVRVIFGRIVDARGEPVINALVRGAEGLAMTDAYGYFQAEIKGGDAALSVKRAEGTCELPLDLSEEIAKESEDLVNVGKLVCAP